MDLIATLKTQHATLEEKFVLLSERLVENDGPGVHTVLRELKETLDGHLLLEDEQLYPQLLNKVSGPEHASQKLLTHSFSDGMGAITGALTRFFARHQGAPLNPDAFAHEWSTLLHALRSRIQAEEVTLYPMYVRLHR